MRSALEQKQGGPRDAAVNFLYVSNFTTVTVSLPQHGFLVGFGLHAAVSYLLKMIGPRKNQSDLI